VGFEQFVPPESLRNLHMPMEAHRWLAHFDASYYRLPDDGDQWEDLRPLSDAQLYEHFLRHGHALGRPYNRFFRTFLEAEEYRRMYPDLGLTDARSAVRHWMYEGVFQRRIPNRQTGLLVDAMVHIFQMGKVGSQSIATSLLKAGFGRFVPNFHWAGDIVTAYPQCFYPYDEIVNWDKDRKLLFISGVRDPLEHLVSSLFQQTLDVRNDRRASDVEDLLRGSVEHVQAALQPNLQWILDWFAHGFFRGIDVYDYPFDAVRGYDIVRQGPVTVFLYRHDALDRCWEPLSELVGLHLKPAFENVSDFKAYADPYRHALAILRGAEFAGLHEQVHASRLWRHFMDGAPGHGHAASTGAPATASSERSAPRGGALARERQPPEPLASWYPPQLAQGWVRLDARLRSVLRNRPSCSLSLVMEVGRGRTTEQRVQISPDNRGAMRFYLCMPLRCVGVILRPEDPDVHLKEQRPTLRALHYRRVLIEVLWWHARHDALGLLSAALRALRAARHSGARGTVRRLIFELDRNVPGFGFRAETAPARTDVPR
jgi:hypothetical protein